MKRNNKKTQSHETVCLRSLVGKVRWFLSWLLLACAVSIPVKSFSQACCTGGVPLSGSLGLGAATQNRLELLITYDHNALRSLVDRSTVLSDDSRNRLSRSGLLELNYGIGQRFSIAGLFSYVNQERLIRTPDGQEDLTRIHGPGDGLILVKYSLPIAGSGPGWQVIAGAGIKFPLGKTNYTNNEGILLPADMQPGSGSFDGLFWAYFARDHLFMDNLSLVSASTFRLTGKNRSYQQSQTYAFGDEVQINLGMNYQFFVSRVMDLFSFIRYRHQVADQINDFAVSGSGGHWVYLVPGLNIAFSPDLSIRISGEIPLYRNLEGLQLTTSYRLSVSLHAGINLKKQRLIFQGLTGI